MNITIKGIAASPGMAVGLPFVYEKAKPEISDAKISDSQIESEIASLYEAASLSAEQISQLINLATAAGEEIKAEIMGAHLILIEDKSFIDEMATRIKSEQISAAAAAKDVSAEYVAMFAAMDDPYLRERGADVDDVVWRMIRNILGLPQTSLSDIPNDSIIIANDITPSDTAQLDPSLIKGFCTQTGGATSHSAIIARMHGIPAVVGASGLLAALAGLDMTKQIALDGDGGEVHIGLGEGDLAEFYKKEHMFLERKEKLRELKDVPAITPDGHRVELVANIASQGDTATALDYGAEGVGLFRTEFLFMDRSLAPTEDEQFEVYKKTAEAMSPRPIIIRTLDIGGDKKTDCLDIPHETNPFLGWRAIRICLDMTNLFKVQLRALLRASAFGKIRIMYPMISRIEELRAANALLEECKKELSTEGQGFDKNIETGIMIEIPAAAVMADILIKEADFFSIGTNDLIQYTAAVDRMNEKIAALYEPLNPGVLRLIKMVIDASHEAGKWTGMCGEMAGNATYAPILLGLGLDEFSMSAAAIPEVKSVVRAWDYSKAKSLADKALVLATAAQIRELLE